MSESGAVARLEAVYPYLKGHRFMANGRSGACSWCGCFKEEHRPALALEALRRGVDAFRRYHGGPPGWDVAYREMVEAGRQLADLLGLSARGWPPGERLILDLANGTEETA